VERTARGCLFHEECDLWMQRISVEPHRGSDAKNRGLADQRIEEDGGEVAERGEK